jgi:GT2 family glycosyltransferase
MMPNSVDPARPRESVSHPLRLLLRVHADAFRSGPGAYLQAVYWRVRGLRVRSRNRLAPMLGRSPAAYSLWISRNERPGSRERTSPLAERSLPFVPVVDCQHGEEGLEATLQSIKAAGASREVVLIGGTARPDAGRVERPAALADFAHERLLWFCPMLPGDRLSPDALGAYAGAAAGGPSPFLIYADDDLLDRDGKRSAPHFKPDWDPDLFAHHDFVSGACLVQVAAETLGRLPDVGWAGALVREALEAGAEPLHIPRVLHHRRQRPDPVIPAKPAELVTDRAPLVSVLIPTRDRIELLRTCVEGLKATNYPRMETIIIDNGSEEPSALAYLESLQAEGFKVLRIPGPFNFSALNNTAVEQAAGELLCFLNNDIEMVDPDWLALLVRQAVRPEIGAVGARLLYPDGSVQHAGVCIGIGGGAGHAHRFEASGDGSYFARSRLPQRVSAVTGACLVVARDKFLAVGGFDSVNFAVAFNDVDLCLKLNASGCQSFYEPRAILIHHESKSRGNDRDKVGRVRFARELEALKRKWHTDRFVDPHHNPNLSPFSEQFLVRL